MCIEHMFVLNQTIVFGGKKSKKPMVQTWFDLD
jgi:hypothetical protein